MKMRALLILILSILPVPVWACTQTTASIIDCNLVSGNVVVTAPAGYHVRLTNKTGTYLQINQVTAATEEQTNWAEFCTFLNDYRTGQLTSGTGEVGCVHKNVGENYPIERWGPGLSVSPNSVVWLDSHTKSGFEKHTYTVSVAPQTSAVYSWRFPAIDQSHSTAGSVTTWTTWKNSSTKTRHLVGAGIYLTGQSQLSAACLYILRSDNSIRWSMCNNGLNKRGFVSISTQLIYPGESLAGQAKNNTSGGWDWAALLLQAR
jgi:hypothetical protein